MNPLKLDVLVGYGLPKLGDFRTEAKDRDENGLYINRRGLNLFQSVGFGADDNGAI